MSVEAFDRYGVAVDVHAHKGQVSGIRQVMVVAFGPRGGVKRPLHFEIPEAEKLRDKLDAAIKEARDL